MCMYVVISTFKAQKRDWLGLCPGGIKDQKHLDTHVDRMLKIKKNAQT